MRQYLRSGDAGPGVRMLVSLALAVLLCGLAAGAPWVLAVITGLASVARQGPAWDATVAWVDDAVLYVSVLGAAVVYMALLHWVWTPSLDHHGRWRLSAWTAWIGLVTTALSQVCDWSIAPDATVAVFAVVCLGTAATLLTWVQVWRRYAQIRPAYHVRAGGEVRCPTCDQSMTDLFDTCCPGCGEQLTVDQLLLRQGFEMPRRDAHLGPSTGEQSP